MALHARPLPTRPTTATPTTGPTAGPAPRLVLPTAADAPPVPATTTAADPAPTDLALTDPAPTDRLAPHPPAALPPVPRDQPAEVGSNALAPASAMMSAPAAIASPVAVADPNAETRSAPARASEPESGPEPRTASHPEAPWYRREPWLAAALAAFVPVGVAVWTPATFKVPLLAVGGLLLALGMWLLARQHRASTVATMPRRGRGDRAEAAE